MSTRAEHLPLRPSLGRIRVADALVENSLLVVLVSVVASVLVGLGGAVLVSDSWMTLVSGREIVQHGLPHHELLTTIPYGQRWTDQQWLAQLAFYGADALGGLRLALLLNAALVTAAVALGVAAALRRGASARSTLFVAAVCVAVAPWSWQLRAQALALPLFVLVLELAARDIRRPARTTFLALPLIAVWANVHGSVVVGAGIASLAGVVGLARRLGRRPDAPGVARSLALALGAPACIVASPYHVHLIGYYRLMLVDSPVSHYITEWKAPRPHGWLVFFFVVAAATALLAARGWRRLGAFDLAVLAVTLAGSLRSGRGIVWFALAALVLVPVALDGVLPPAGRIVVRRRVSAAVVALALAGVGVAVVAVSTRPSSWFERGWPTAAADAVERAAAAVPGRPAVYPSDKHGDWLLWKAPSLRGRVAYDVRFEFLDDAQIRSLIRFKSFRKGWDDVAAPYRILVLDPGETGPQARALRRLRARTLYADRTVVVLERPAP